MHCIYFRDDIKNVDVIMETYKETEREKLHTTEGSSCLEGSDNTNEDMGIVVQRKNITPEHNSTPIDNTGIKRKNKRRLVNDVETPALAKKRKVMSDDKKERKINKKVKKSHLKNNTKIKQTTKKKPKANSTLVTISDESSLKPIKPNREKDLIERHSGQKTMYTGVNHIEQASSKIIKEKKKKRMDFTKKEVGAQVKINKQNQNKQFQKVKKKGTRKRNL